MKTLRIWRILGGWLSVAVAQTSCGSQQIIEDTTSRAVIVGSVSAQTAAAGGVAVHATAYSACPDSGELGGGVAEVGGDGKYELIVISGSSPRMACVIVSALRKTPPRNDSVAAVPVMVMLRSPETRLDTAHVDLELP